MHEQAATLIAELVFAAKQAAAATSKPLQDKPISQECRQNRSQMRPNQVASLLLCTAPCLPAQGKNELLRTRYGARPSIKMEP